MISKVNINITRVTKKVLDNVYRPVQAIEETFDNHAILLPGMERSFQTDTYSCGLQSVFMILKYYGKARSIKAVKKALKTSKEEGTSEDDILRVFRERRLKTEVINEGGLRKLEKAINKGYPVLVWFNKKDDHYSVVYGYSKTHIWILDPVIFNSVRPKQTRDKFKKRWKGWGVIVKG